MRLFTNVDYATIWRGGEPVRAHISALLLETPLGLSTTRDADANGRIRGFGPDGAWPVFDVGLGCKWDAYETRDAEDRSALFLGDGDDEPRPLSRGATLLWVDGTAIYLTVNDHERPIDISDHDDEAYPEVWDHLSEKAREYWTAPNMPTLRWVSAVTA